MDAIAEKLGSDIIMLDMQEITLLADYFILCNADSTPQFKAISQYVDERATAVGGLRLHIEGQPSSGWVLLDYGQVVVHIFEPRLRAYYNLEELWNKARLVVHVQ